LIRIIDGNVFPNDIKNTQLVYLIFSEVVFGGWIDFCYVFFAHSRGGDD
jgi:hypothetical protein